jgi:hypothetical protein
MNIYTILKTVKSRAEHSRAQQSRAQRLATPSENYIIISSTSLVDECAIRRHSRGTSISDNRADENQN